MKIIQDSREQTPLVFDNPLITEVKVEALNVGDYMCEFENGFTPPVSFERKSIGDLFSTLGKGYRRFKKEIERAKESETRLELLIEGSISKVEKGIKWSKRAGEEVARQVMTIYMKYDIRPVFCVNANDASLYITRYFEAIGKLYVKGGFSEMSKSR